MSDRLVKNAVIARSGTYQYTRDELAALGLPTPPAWIGDKDVYNVYRPAPVIAVAVAQGKFSHLPLTLLHPSEMVDRANFKDHVAGWTGDTAELVYARDVDEALVRTMLTIGDADAADAYNNGTRELSHGYTADFRWRTQDEDPKHDAIMTTIRDGNHVALVPKGRAGSVAAILDHKAGPVKQFVTGLFRYAKARVKMVADRSVAKDDFLAPVDLHEKGFGAGLRHVIETRATLSDEEVGKKVDELKKLLSDLPAGDEKSLLMRFMDDMKMMKGEDDETLESVQGIVCALVTKLDRAILGEMEDAMKDEKSEGGKVGEGEPKPPETAPSASGGKTTDEPGPVPPPPEKKDEAKPAEGEKPGAKPPMPAAPAAAAAPAAGAAQHKSPAQWADELFNFLDAMRADLEAQKAAPAAGAAPGAPAQPAAPAAPAAPAQPESVPAEDAKSDPPPESGVPVQKPDGSDKPGKPDGDETKHEGIGDAAPMASVNALIEDDKKADAVPEAGIEAQYAALKGRK